jgi:endonuclease/exonuclease/phosphatase (EEP) superfamily protein YafD
MPRTLTSRISGWLVWAYLAAVCLIAITMWGLGDVTVVGTVLLFMGRWVFLLPLALLVPAALLMDRRMLAPLAIAGLVALGPIMGARTGWRRLLPAAEGTHLRVVTFNAESGRLLIQRLPEMVTGWKADVLAFQECGDDFASILARVPAWHLHASRSLCVLSRFPIRDAAVMDRSSLDVVKQSGNNLIGGAGYVVRLTLDGPTGPLRVTNLHLETPRKGLEGFMAGDLRRLRSNTTIREVESRLARRWADSGSGPAIVLGDFNTPVESRIFQRHWGDLDDAFSVAGTGLGMTKYNGWIRARIDHVLVGPEWRVDRVTMGPAMGSDHRPLIVDLTLRKDR